MQDSFSRSLLIMIAAVVAALGCGMLPESPYRQMLPDSASEIQENRSGTVDFTYLLRARITEQEFQAIVAQIDLVAEQGVASTEPLPRHPDDPPWWSPIGSGEGVFRLKKDGDIISAKYEDGVLFLSVVHL